jgi:UDP-N-acetylglucosamine--dolichyl-phosphate N-acetylglucosaminephosphotransferase
LNLLAVLVAVLVSGIVAYWLSRFLSVRLKRMGISGVDVHKPDAPETAEMGGLAVLLALIPGTLLLAVLNSGIDTRFLLAFLTIALVGCIGVADDTLGIRQRVKPLLIVLASIPMMYLLAARSSIELPLIGSIPLGILYPLVVVPLAITTSANFTNLLAGFNGLEAGIATIGLTTISVLAWANGAFEIATLGLLLSAAYAGFLVLNWYPAKIFPGDTGTLMAGGALAVIGLAGGVATAAIILSIPAAMDFTLKMLSRTPFQGRKDYGNTSVDSRGILSPPPYQALAHAFMRVGSLSEKKLVMSLLGMEGAYAVLAVFVQLSRM